MASPKTEFLSQFRFRQFVPLGGFHQVGRKSLLHILGQDLPDLFDQCRCVCSLGERSHRVAQARLGQGAQAKPGVKGLPFRHQSKEITSLVAQHIRKHLGRRVVLAIVAGHAKRDHEQSVGQIGLELKGLRRHGLQSNGGALRNLLGGDTS